MSRDYNAEIIQALKQKPRNGEALQANLHISPYRMPNILKSMEEDSIIHWVQPQELDGEWRLNKGGEL